MDKKYYEIYDWMRHAILNGDYAAGSKLPSKRSMADRSGCSVVTVAAAYALLEQEGYITSRQRSGYYVCRIDAPIAPKKEETAAEE